MVCWTQHATAYWHTIYNIKENLSYSEAYKIKLKFSKIFSPESKPALQFLPPREGYVPVYIRVGDTPLREVNPDIDAAFHEDETVARRIDEEVKKIQNSIYRIKEIN